MDHSTLDEQQTAERYLQGKLSPEEAAAFEEHSLACPECLERLELAETLRDGLRTLAVQEVEREAATRVTLLAALARLGRSRAVALGFLALAVVAVLPAGLLLRELDQTRATLERREAAAEDAEQRVGDLERRLREAQAAPPYTPDPAESGAAELRRERDRLRADLERARRPQVNVPVISLGAERSGSSEPSQKISLAVPSDWIFLSLEVDDSGHSTYRAVLTGPGGKPVWQGGDLVLLPDQTLSITLPKSLLAPGNFTLRVEGVPAAGAPVPVARFSFRAVS
jgi:hypothetical protein